MVAAVAEKPTRTRKAKEAKPAEETSALPAWTVEASALRAALALVAPAAKSRMWGQLCQISAMGSEDGRLSVATDDHELMLSASVEAAVETSGRVAVAHDVLTSLARGAEGALRCRLAGKGLDVAGEGTEATIRTPADVPPTTMPDLPGSAVPVKAAALASAIGRVERCAAGERDSRTKLTGVLIEGKPDGLVLAAADGFRLGVAHVAGEVAWPDPVIVPGRNIRALAKLLDHLENGAEVRIGATENGNAVVAEAPGWRWASRLIDGTFPDYQQILPREFATTAELDREALAWAVSVAVGFAHKLANDSGAQVIRFLVGGSPSAAVAEPHLTVEASDADRGAFSRRLPADVTGTPLHILFDAAKLRDALAAHDAPKVLIGLNSSQQAATFREPGGEDVLVLMPMIVGSDGGTA